MPTVNSNDAGIDPISSAPLSPGPVAVTAPHSSSDNGMRNAIEWIVIIAIAVGFAFLVRGVAFQTLSLIHI